MIKPLTETLDRKDSYSRPVGSDPIKGYGTAEPPSIEERPEKYPFTVKEHLYKEIAVIDRHLKSSQERREDLVTLLALLPSVLSDKQESTLKRLLDL